MVTAAQQLATALKGNIPAGNETAEALKKVSELFTKIAQTKQDHAKAKEQCNWLQANPAARVAAPLPRVAKAQIPMVALTTEADCQVVQIVASPLMPRPVEQPPVTRSQSRSPLVNAQSSMACPNYILQDDNDDVPNLGRQRIIPYKYGVDLLPGRRQTRSATRSIMQEAMFACVNLTTSSPRTLASSATPATHGRTSQYFPSSYQCKKCQ